MSVPIIKEKPTSLRILFAEDDDDLRFALTSVLVSDGGFQVEACASGEEAIELLKQQTFDVVVLDYKMPGLSGLNVLQWMHEQKMETPVLFLTGAGTETVAVEAMKLGAYDYCRKELVEIEHLPLIINGIYERYLFKKERENRIQLEQKYFESMKTFYDTVSSIVPILQRSLTVMVKDIEQQERELIPYLPPETQQKFIDAFAALKQEHSVIAFAVRSILHAINVLNDTSKQEKKAQEVQAMSGISS